MAPILRHLAPDAGPLRLLSMCFSHIVLRLSRGLVRIALYSLSHNLTKYRRWHSPHDISLLSKRVFNRENKSRRACLMQLSKESGHIIPKLGTNVYKRLCVHVSRNGLKRKHKINMNL